jgi:hypothetical protein
MRHLAAAFCSVMMLLRSPVAQDTGNGVTAGSIPLFVTVMDQDQRAVSTLTKDEFEVHDGGKAILPRLPCTGETVTRERQHCAQRQLLGVAANAAARRPPPPLVAPAAAVR